MKNFHFLPLFGVLFLVHFSSSLPAGNGEELCVKAFFTSSPGQRIAMQSVLLCPGWSHPLERETEQIMIPEESSRLKKQYVTVAPGERELKHDNEVHAKAYVGNDYHMYTVFLRDDDAETTTTKDPEMPYYYTTTKRSWEYPEETPTTRYWRDDDTTTTTYYWRDHTWPYETTTETPFWDKTTKRDWRDEITETTRPWWDRSTTRDWRDEITETTRYWRDEMTTTSRPWPENPRDETTETTRNWRDEMTTPENPHPQHGSTFVTATLIPQASQNFDFQDVHLYPGWTEILTETSPQLMITGRGSSIRKHAVRAVPGKQEILSEERESVMYARVFLPKGHVDHVTIYIDYEMKEDD